MVHFFTQSLSSFHNTCPYHRNLFCCITDIISTIPSLSLNSLLETLSFNLMPHIHLSILVSAVWSAISFSQLNWFVCCRRSHVSGGLWISAAETRSWHCKCSRILQTVLQCQAWGNVTCSFIAWWKVCLSWQYRLSCQNEIVCACTM